MDDAIKATIDIINAPIKRIKERTSYNLSGMSFSSNEIYNSIKKYYPNFNISYVPVFRQTIADSKVREDWGWIPDYDLDSMIRIMICELSKN